MKPFHVVFFLTIIALLHGCYDEPVANFEYSYVDNLAPADISFTNLSTEADKFQWDFGDGSSSLEENPKHTFNNWIDPTVTLQAKGRGGENTISQALDITSYYVKNSSSFYLYNVWTFFWNESNEEIVDDFELGNLALGASSNVVITNHTLINVAFETFDGTRYIADPAFELSPNMASYLNITDVTTVLEVTGKKKGTQFQLDLMNIRENGQKILLKDLLAQ